MSPTIGLLSAVMAPKVPLEMVRTDGETEKEVAEAQHKCASTCKQTRAGVHEHSEMNHYISAENSAGISSVHLPALPRRVTCRNIINEASWYKTTLIA